jgi:hypothetical protein
MTDDTPQHDTTEDPERESGEPGARGDSQSAERLPPAPASDDDTPLGDTDQHSRVSSARPE